MNKNKEIAIKSTQNIENISISWLSYQQKKIKQSSTIRKRLQTVGLHKIVNQIEFIEIIVTNYLSNRKPERIMNTSTQNTWPKSEKEYT